MTNQLAEIIKVPVRLRLFREYSILLISNYIPLEMEKSLEMVGIKHLHVSMDKLNAREIWLPVAPWTCILSRRVFHLQFVYSNLVVSGNHLDKPVLKASEWIGVWLKVALIAMRDNKFNIILHWLQRLRKFEVYQVYFLTE